MSTAHPLLGNRTHRICGTRSRAYRGNCTLPVGHAGLCVTEDGREFVAQLTVTRADDEPDFVPHAESPEVAE